MLQLLLLEKNNLIFHLKIAVGYSGFGCQKRIFNVIVHEVKISKMQFAGRYVTLP